MPDLSTLLDRTTPTDLAPPDTAALARRGRHRRARRRAALLSPPVVALAVAAAVALPPGGGDVATGDGGHPVDTRQVEGVDGVEGVEGEVRVYLAGDVTEGEVEAIEERLLGEPLVVEVSYVDREAALEEYRRIFAGNPEMLDQAEQDPDLVPAWFRARLADGASHDQARALADEVAVAPGVTRVTTAGR